MSHKQRTTIFGIVFWTLLLASVGLVGHYEWLQPAWAIVCIGFLVVGAVSSTVAMFKNRRLSNGRDCLPRWMMWVVLDDEQYDKYLQRRKLTTPDKKAYWKRFTACSAHAWAEGLSVLHDFPWIRIFSKFPWPRGLASLLTSATVAVSLIGYTAHTMTVFSAAIFLVFGIYLVFNGVTADTLIDESEGTATEEQRAEAKATPLKRFVVVTAGAISALYGLWKLFN
jgi:hypothetical protein